MALTKYDYVYKLPDEISDNGAGMREVEAEADVYWLLKRLPKRQRECFKLLIGGDSYKDIANKLGISESSVRTHIQKVRQKNTIYAII